ncbi:MAG: SPOR domain-containing protein [Gammaproteobacteria bacterium]|nr:SPOR domain-containing protein [Gammaproteobacteria bacterium]
MAEDRSFDPRRRVLGAVVLVTAAVIFLPMVFKAPRAVAPGDDVLTVVRSGKGLRAQWHPASAPVAAIRPQAAAAPAVAVVRKTAPVVAAPPAPVPSARPAAVPPSSWIVQVGAYVNASDAIAFANRLKTQGFHVHMHLMPLAHSRGIVVTIGPYGQATAAAAVRRIARLDHIRGLVEPGPG